MGALRIKSLVYKGDLYEYKSPDLNKNIVVIEGPNRTGKSTFFDLLYYALGGKVDQFSKTSKKKHEEITKDKNNYVRIDVLVNEVSLSLVRKIGDNGILVIEDGKESKFLSVNRNLSEDYIFSDWILDKLDIDVVDITQGSSTFKLNFHDLTRLIYHNQSADPALIYKPADATSFVSDSLYVRKAIFEVLVGKSLLDYYKALSDYKRKQKEYDSAKSLHTEYSSLVSDMIDGDEIQNIESINRSIVEKEERLEQLTILRKDSIKVVPSPVNAVDEINFIKEEKLKLEYKNSQAEMKFRTLANELSGILEGKKNAEIDIDRISKIILTHEQLELFSPDTCPYCLSTVSRAANKCICGCDVKEDEYQRFFYSPSEYQEILKSKVKSLDTFNEIISEIQEEIELVKSVMENRKAALIKIDSKLKDKLSSIEISVDFDNLEKIDQQIIDIKEEISSLEQLAKLEKKLGSYSKIVNTKKDSLRKSQRTLAQKELDAKNQLEERIKEFGGIYGSFMKESLSDVREADIDPDTYMPIINGGVYREASAGVSVRFLYYLSLLKLSLDKPIPYPKFLLIDTPETAGIDYDNLNLILSNVVDLNNNYDTNFQSIIATGVGKYPDSMKESVLISLSKDSKLLNLISTVEA